MFILIDVDGHPVQMVTKSVQIVDHPVFFHPLTRLCNRQRKHQPSLLMTEQTWNYLKRPDVTHEGAFGSDFFAIPKAVMKERFVDAAIDPHTTRWVVVWKFPGDLNHLRTSSGGNMFRKILDIPLPVGEYPLIDDEWTGMQMDHDAFPKNSMAEKLRTDVQHGNGVHYLENRNGIKVAMIGSHFFIKEFWKVTEKEKKGVVAMIRHIQEEVGMYCFPCYGQHHAIVFYLDRNSQLVTPSRLSKLLQTTNLPYILNQYSYYDVESWASNLVRLTSKSTFASSPPKTHVSSSHTKTHVQPHPTGSLLRKRAEVDSVYASQRPVPNHVQVQVSEERGEFTWIRFGTLEGWVRTKYLG